MLFLPMFGRMMPANGCIIRLKIIYVALQCLPRLLPPLSAPVTGAR